MALRKRQRGLMPKFLNSNCDGSEEDFDELNQQLNNLQDVNVTSDVESNDLGTRRSQPNSNYRSRRPRPSKRQRTEASGNLNIPTPWDDSSGRLPSLESDPDSASPAEFIAGQKRFEEVSLYAKRCFSTSATPGSSESPVDGASNTKSGHSELTNLDMKSSSPLDGKHAQGHSTSENITSAKAIYVTSFEDLVTVDLEIFRVEKRYLNHEKLRPGVDTVEPMECNEGTKSEVNAADTMSQKKPNKRDVSLLERFTEEEIKLHLMSLQGSGQSGVSEMCCDLKDDEACQLCGDARLLYPPTPMYCSSCSGRIKDESFYYIPGEEPSDVQQQICSSCHSKCRSKFELCGITITKAKMIKKNNLDNQISEEWVQCESCKKWQHQICGLYNRHKDVDNTADYACPKCLLEERKSINNRGVADNTDLGAKDLPETILSYFIEKRLFRRLKEERSETAKATGKSINDVPEPEGLTLRVVFSADRTSIVNKQLADLLQKENYPSEFPYRSKVILLFQKVEGVDVCIFALFVQEFGSECSQPNQRSTYITYLDSVKYFRPERVTSTREALRTFVYHEILIGYLEYCKLRGFTTCYIWACPPTKGEDYIMYSHPKTQQTPNTRKLRQWYMKMLTKAVEQGAVTSVTNLHDRFFVAKEESTCNITAARLPYFEGSFWSHNAELLVQAIERDENNVLQKKMKSLSRRKLNAMSYKSTGCVDVDDAKNILLMEKLNKLVHHNKDDFMVVELNYSCTRCSKAILSGLRWFCDKCKNLQLCESCCDAEQEVPGEHTHTVNGKEKHQLSKVQVNGILPTTEDKDIIIQENNMFESRQAFLSFSQTHNYNFDMLRRAKHSSMMILYHLHTSNKRHCSQNSSPLPCTVCGKDVSTTIYFPCLLCPDYRACTGCYTNNIRLLRHYHLFHTLASANGTPPRTVLVLEILNAMSHAVNCPPTASKSCKHPRCNEVKALFSHRRQCKAREKGESCEKICDKLLQTIKIHAFHCEDHKCPVPGCRDKEQLFIRKVP